MPHQPSNEQTSKALAMAILSFPLRTPPRQGFDPKAAIDNRKKLESGSFYIQVNSLIEGADAIIENETLLADTSPARIEIAYSKPYLEELIAGLDKLSMGANPNLRELSAIRNAKTIVDLVIKEGEETMRITQHDMGPGGIHALMGKSMDDPNVAEQVRDQESANYLRQKNVVDNLRTHVLPLFTALNQVLDREREAEGPTHP